MAARDAHRAQRGQEQRDRLLVAGDAGFAEELGADLHDLARRARARRQRVQHAARIAEPRDARFVEHVRVDARHLRRDVGAHAQHAAGHRVDDLERLQLQVAAGAGGQRVQVLDERRLHQPIAAREEVIEQRATQLLDAQGLVGQQVLDVLGQQPVTHGAGREVRAQDGTGP